MKASDFPGKNKKWDENENLVATAAYETLTEEEKKSLANTKQADLVYTQLCAWYPQWTRPITGQRIDLLKGNAANRSLCQKLEDEKDEKEELRKKVEVDKDNLQKARACVGHVKRKNKMLEDENKKLEDLVHKAAGLEIK